MKEGNKQNSLRQ